MVMEEKHNCKLCFKTFANGRALGGHMRSHLFHPKPPAPAPAPPSSSSESEYENSDGYHLRKKRFRLRNSENSFTGDVTVAGDGGGAVVLLDGESETESSRNVTVGRRRSKRIRKPVISWLDDHQRHFHQIDRYNYIKTRNQSKSMMIVNESSCVVHPDSVSSISDFSPEEDVAYCLMMLSRDKWIEEEDEKPDENDSDTDSDSESEEERSKYRCNTCNKVFGSYQALGGHRASHKKIKFIHHNNSNQQSQNGSIEDRIHECPVCFKVFASGQALGGHKRSHFTASSSSSSAINEVIKPVTNKKQRINLIDLNLPAPIEDDDVSQIEVSVVSDGEFVKRH